ncbi:MAG: hypothetical protein NT062_07770 [Proteobacteria bacterium]|nr:hypothetical protein [Pseudomonadota bacterium]
MSNTHALEVKETTTTTANVESVHAATTDSVGGVVDRARTLVTKNPDPTAVAKLIHEHPDAKDAILAMLNQTMGAEYGRAVVELAHKDDLRADKKAGKKIDKKERVGTGYTKTGPEKTRDALARVAADGKLQITAGQIGQLDAISKIETGGKAAAVDTTDDEIVSIGFHQLVLGSLSIQRVMEATPEAFSRHGLVLDKTKKYDFKSSPYQIVGAPHEELLRTHEWGDRFLAASGEDLVIAAIAKYALQDQAKTAELQHDKGGTSKFFDDDTAKAWVTEYYNSRPAFTGTMLKRAVDAGINSAPDRDTFLDILSHTIVSSYTELETQRYLNAAKASYRKSHHKKDMPADEAQALLDAKKAKWDAIGHRKSTNIVTSIPRHIDLSKVHGATAKADAVGAKPTAFPVPVAPVDDHAHAVAHHDDHASDTPAPPPKVHKKKHAHHDDHHDDQHDDHAHDEQVQVAKPVVSTPAPVIAAPAPTHDDKHEVAKAPVVTPVASPTALATTTPANGDKHGGGGKVHTIQPGKGYPTVHAYLPPGGVTDSVEVFLFLHGMFAYTSGGRIDDPKPEQAMGLAQAMAATPRNLITFAPLATMSDQFPLWNAIHSAKGGWKGFLDAALLKLGNEIGVDLSMASLSVAGHSAGGAGLGFIGKDLGDVVHDMTYEDGGYGNKAGSTAWTDNHQRVAEWFVGGKTDKRLRVLLHDGGEDRKTHERKEISEATALHTNLNEDNFRKIIGASKDVTFTHDEGDWKDKRSIAGLHERSRLTIHGLEGGPRTMTVFQFSNGENHMGLRNDATKHLITESRDTEFAPGAAQAQPVVTPGAATPGAATARPVFAPQPVDAAPSIAPNHHHEHHEHREPTAAAPAAANVATKPAKKHHAHHDAETVDALGNATVRKFDMEKNVNDATHRVFTNSFVTLHEVNLVTRDGHKSGHKLAASTVIHLHEVRGKQGQVEGPGVQTADDLWIDFSHLGGHGTTSPGFGNEAHDAIDKERADAIRAKLPTAKLPSGRPPPSTRGSSLAPSSLRSVASPSTAA